jgi:polar amino acid transport system substrate-binding protein
MRKTTTLFIALFAIIAVACSSAGVTGSPTVVATPAPSVAVASVAPTDAPTEAPAETPTTPPASPDPCAPDKLALVTPGTLTIGTDNPAFPPYFLDNADGSTTDPWEFGDPTNGQGFESAFAYALAEQLGFSADQVAWTYVPFANSYKPGPKDFDIDINQVSYRPKRAASADLSDGYYFLNQAVVARSDNPIAAVTSLTALADFRFGAQVGTTSYETITDVIKPTKEPSVYDTNTEAIAALKAGQIDAIVVDLPTAFFMSAVQVKKGTVVGQFPLAAGAEPEYFSVVLAKDSPVTACVNAAIAAMNADGSLAAITQEWLSDKVAAPIFTP